MRKEKNWTSGEDTIKLLGGSATVKDRPRIIFIALCASLSAIMFGYSLKEITSINVETIIVNYGISIDKHLLQGMLIAVMPFGGLFGSLLAKTCISLITRLRGMHATLPVLVLSILIVQVTTPVTLFLGRFLEGVCIGYYVSIAPIYLKEISPKEMRAVIGTFFALGKIMGVLLVIILELWLGDENWRILLSITAILACLQSIVLMIVGIDTPSEWIARSDLERARQSIHQIYKSEYVEQMLQEMIQDYEIEKLKNLPDCDIEQSLAFEQKKRRAFYVAINVCIIRHFSGGNSLITSAGIIMSQYDKGLATWTPLIINVTQFVALAVYVLFFSSMFGKRALLVTSSGLLALLNLALIVSLIYRLEEMILLSIMAFMIIYGGMMLSAVWSYPSEIIPAAESLVPNTVHWIALSLSTLAPSLVMSIMPTDEVYPCFLFFLGYTLLAFFYFRAYVVESNGLSYQQTIQRFQQ